jgi:hypothetical protein
MTSTNLIALQTRVAAVLPLLEANVGAAYREWMDGTLARGAYEYCLHRSAVASAIAGSPLDELVVEAAFLAGAPLFIDLHSAMKDVPSERQPGEQAKVDALHSLYIAQGFTEMHPHLKIPVLPSNCVAQSSLIAPA